MNTNSKTVNPSASQTPGRRLGLLALRDAVTSITALCLILATAGAQDHVRIAHSGDIAPGGGAYGQIRSAVIDEQGTVIFHDGTGRLFQWVNGTITLLVGPGVAAPTGGTFSNVSDFLSSGAGDIAFKASTSFTSNQNLFLRTSAGISSVAVIGQSAPSGGVYDILYGYSVASPGVVAFLAKTAGGAGDGVYLRTLAGVSTIAAAGDPTPNGNFFTSFTTFPLAPGVNSTGDVAFQAFESPPSGSGFNSMGIFLKKASGIVRLATGAGNGYDYLMLNSAGQASFRNALGSPVYFGATADMPPLLTSGSPLNAGRTASQFQNFVTSNAGHSAFRASDQLSTTGMFSRDASGLITRVAQFGSPAPGGGTFSGEGLSTIPIPVVNSFGQFCFVATTNGGKRLFYWDGSVLSKVIGRGDTLDLLQIDDLIRQFDTVPTPGHREVNDFSRMVYIAVFQNGTRGLYIYTLPTVRVSEFGVFSGVPRISFSTAVGRTYVVERKSSLSDPNWVTVTGAGAVAGNGSIRQVEDTDPGAGAAASRYYRVRVIP